MPKYPQLLKNLRFEDKNAMMRNEGILAVIAEVHAEINSKERVLVRPSGCVSWLKLKQKNYVLLMLNEF